MGDGLKRAVAAAKATRGPTAKEIAEKINAHLRRFERDPIINAVDPKHKTRPFYYAGAGSSGRFVSIVYVSYQGRSNLTRGAALRYLAWLDAGNVGTHYEADRQVAAPNDAAV